MTNAVIALREKRKDESWMEMNEVKATSTQLNVHENTLQSDESAGSGVPTNSHLKCSKSSFAKILHQNHYCYGRINERGAVLYKKNTMIHKYTNFRRKKYLARYDADPEWDVVYQVR